MYSTPGALCLLLHYVFGALIYPALCLRCTNLTTRCSCTMYSSATWPRACSIECWLKHQVLLHYMYSTPGALCILLHNVFSCTMSSPALYVFDTRCSCTMSSPALNVFDTRCSCTMSFPALYVFDFRCSCTMSFPALYVFDTRCFCTMYSSATWPSCSKIWETTTQQFSLRCVWGCGCGCVWGGSWIIGCLTVSIGWKGLDCITFLRFLVPYWDWDCDLVLSCRTHKIPFCMKCWEGWWSIIPWILLGVVQIFSYLIGLVIWSCLAHKIPFCMKCSEGLQ